MSKITKILVPVAALMLSATACTWNDYKPLDYFPATPEQLDPQGYAERLAAAKAYKETEHNVMFVGMEGSAEKVSSQAMHPMSMPDSVDYIIVKNPANIHPTQEAELKEVYQKKGTKALAYLDLDALRAEWDEYQEERRVQGLKPSETAEEIKWFADKTAEALAAINTSLYQGLYFTAVGAPTPDQKSYLAEVHKWMDANAQMEFMLSGSILNIKDLDLLKKCKYVSVQAGEDSSIGELLILIPRILSKHCIVPDRVLIEVTVPSIESPAQVGATPQTAAQLVVQEKNNESFSVKGVVVINGHDDYYRYDMIYSNVRKAISIMNPINE